MVLFFVTHTFGTDVKIEIHPAKKDKSKIAHTKSTRISLAWLTNPRHELGELFFFFRNPAMEFIRMLLFFCLGGGGSLGFLHQIPSMDVGGVDESRWNPAEVSATSGGGFLEPI